MRSVSERYKKEVKVKDISSIAAVAKEEGENTFSLIVADINRGIDI